MLLEVIIFAVFQHEDAVVFQQTLFEDEVRNRGNLLQRIGRVGKDKVELLMTALEETEHVGTQWNAGLLAQFLDALADKAVMIPVHLYADHLTAASRQQFQRDAACAREEVEGRSVFEVHILHQHVEDVLLGKVGSGPRLKRTRNVEVPSLVFSCYNPHLPLSSSISFYLPLSPLNIQCLQVIGHPLDFCDGMTVEVCRGVDDVGLLQEVLQLLHQPLLLRNVAHDVQFVVFRL